MRGSRQGGADAVSSGYGTVWLVSLLGGRFEFDPANGMFYGMEVVGLMAEAEVRVGHVARAVFARTCVTSCIWATLRGDELLNEFSPGADCRGAPRTTDAQRACVELG